MLNKGRAKTTLQCMLSMIMVLWALCIPSHTAQSFLAWSFLERILSPQLKVFHDINSHYSPQIIAGFLQDCVDSSLWKLQCVLVYFTSFDIVVNLPSALGMVGVSTIWMHLYLNEKACVSFLVKNLLVGSSGIWTRERPKSFLQGLQNYYIVWPETYRLWQQLSDNLHLQGHDCISDTSCSH